MITKFNEYKEYNDGTNIKDLISQIHSGKIIFVEKWIKDGKELDDYSLKNSPLIEAIAEYHYDIAKILIEAGADINFQDNRGQTPLIWAAIRVSIDLIELMMEKNPDLSLYDKMGYSFFDYLMSYTNEEYYKNKYKDIYQAHVRRQKVKDFNL